MGVGPLILAPFLLEHSFWGILGLSSDVTAGRRVFVSSAVGGWGWEIVFTSACSSPRERAARPNNISLQLARLRERAVEKPRRETFLCNTLCFLLVWCLVGACACVHDVCWWCVCALDVAAARNAG